MFAMASSNVRSMAGDIDPIICIDSCNGLKTHAIDVLNTLNSASFSKFFVIRARNGVLKGYVYLARMIQAILGGGGAEVGLEWQLFLCGLASLRKKPMTVHKCTTTSTVQPSTLSIDKLGAL